MANKESIKQLLHSVNLSATDKLLLILAINHKAAKKIRDVREVATEIGVRQAKNWNISQYLKKSKGKAILTNNGWELGPLGIEHAVKLGAELDSKRPKKIVQDLRDLSKSISNPSIQSFVNEAVVNLESDCYRSAITISWVGAIAVLYSHVLDNKLTEFNAEAKRRNPKWKDAINFDDLADMKENNFLDVCHAISILGKSVKDELKSRLKMRNGAGHPNTFSVGENMVKAHIESLIKNVYKKF